MIPFLQKNYGAFIKGAIVTIGLSIMLSNASFIIIKPAYVSTPVYFAIHIVSFIFCWLVLSFSILKFPPYKSAIVIGLLVAIIIIENFIDIPFNFVTIPLLILFWLGVAYLIAPEFFRKYKIAILSVYGIILSYFFIFRMLPNYIEDHHQNFLNFVVIPIPIFIGLWMYEQWRWLKTLKVDKAKAELSSLKSQINPHFFFNTLNNLYGLVIEKSEKAPEVVLKLSDMMRYTIYEGKKDFVLVKDEIRYLENYIELHKIVTQVSSLTIWETLKTEGTLVQWIENVPDEFYTWIRKVEADLQANFSKIENSAKVEYKEMATDSETAAYFKTCEYPAVLFAMKNNKKYDQIIWKYIRPTFEKAFSNEFN